MKKSSSLLPSTAGIALKQSDDGGVALRSLDELLQGQFTWEREREREKQIRAYCLMSLFVHQRRSELIKNRLNEQREEADILAGLLSIYNNIYIPGNSLFGRDLTWNARKLDQCCLMKRYSASLTGLVLVILCLLGLFFLALFGLCPVKSEAIFKCTGSFSPLCGVMF